MVPERSVFLLHIFSAILPRENFLSSLRDCLVVVLRVYTIQYTVYIYTPL